MSNHIKYELNNNLPLLKADFPGNIIINGRFSKDLNKKQTHLFKTIRWIVKRNPQKEALIKEKSIIKVNKINNFEDNKIYWLGHSCFYINIAGVSFITDPVFFDLITNKRDTELPFNINDLKNLSYLLISHDHYDHLSVKSISSLLKNNPDMEALLPLKTSELFNSCPLKWIARQEAGWYQSYIDLKKDVKVTFLPADHWCRRGLFDQNKRLWGSFMIEYKGIKIFFAGDTAYNEEMYKDIKEIMGSPDICLMPIGSYSPHYMMRDHHINPEESAALFNILGGKKFIPMHYGTYTMSSEPAGEPVRRIKKVIDKDKLILLEIGGEYNL